MHKKQIIIIIQIQYQIDMKPPRFIIDKLLDVT